MNQWSECDLADAVETIQSGGRPKGGASEDSGEIPSLGGENILQSGGMTLSNFRRVPYSFYKRMNKGLLRPLDVLINKDGANTGKVGIYDGRFQEASINEHLFLLRAREGVLGQEYLYYLLLSQKSQKTIRAKISGSAQPGLKSSFTRDFSISIPIRAIEQSKIVEILNSVDRAIEQTETLIAKYQRVKTGLMQDLLTRGIDENGNLRDPATHAFKDSPLGRIPVEWQICTLTSVANRITSGSRGWAKYYSSEGALFVRIGNLTRRHIHFRWDDVQYVKPPKSGEGRRTCLEFGDLLISITADLGIVGVVPEGMGEAYINQHIALVKLNGDLVNPWYVGHFLASERAQNWINQLNESGAKAGLNLATVASLPIVLPTFKEQDAAVKAIESLENSMAIGTENLQKLRREKAGLMQDLLTGKVPIDPLLAENEVS